MKPIPLLAPALPAAALALLVAAPAQAYIGPGVGLGVIGTVFGIVATLALAVFGFLWYPMKRLMAKRRGTNAKSGAAVPPAVAANEAATKPVDTAVAVPPSNGAEPGTLRPDVVPVESATPAAPAPTSSTAPTSSGARTPERDGA